MRDPMRDTQPLLDAIHATLNDRAPVAAAIQESRRRMHRARNRRRTTLAALAFTALTAAAWWPDRHSKEPSRAAVAEKPMLQIFSTRENTSPLPIFSTSESRRPFALFSSRDERLTIRNIDDRTLFELLNPYGPVIVYVGADKQPTLLLLNPAH